jgi:putative transposase
MNPVRANRVDHPGHYRWSSYHGHPIGRSASIVKDHAVCLRIASTPEERRERYRALLRTDRDASVVDDVRKAVAFSVPFGNHLFKEQIEEGLNRVN